MEPNILLRQNLKSSGIIILVGFCFGLIYPLFGDDWSDTTAFINGISIGVIGGVILSFFEYFVFKMDSRKWSFINILIIKTILYFTLFSLLVMSVYCYTRSIENHQGFWEFFKGEKFRNFILNEDFFRILIYCLIALIIINFTRQINRKIGHGVLINFILGRYHTPKEEERIFAFIDLKNSTRIAEELGALKFHNLLYEFFHDIALCILATKGEIYRYVGDEIVISWKLHQGLADANCLRAYYFMKRQLKKNREKYLTLFGFVPDFHAAFYAGRVIRGEIGDVKSQLVFHGETMYIASKMENQCGPLGCDILVSSELIQQLSVPIVYEMQYVGLLEWNENIELYTLREKETTLL